MPDYQQGKIYKITCEDETYYGSTAATLEKRMYWHKSSYKRWKDNKNNDRYTCFELFDKCSTIVQTYKHIIQFC